MQYGNCYYYGRTHHYDYSHCSGCTSASSFCGTSSSSGTAFTNSEVEVWHHHGYQPPPTRSPTGVGQTWAPTSSPTTKAPTKAIMIKAWGGGGGGGQKSHGNSGGAGGYAEAKLMLTAGDVLSVSACHIHPFSWFACFAGSPHTTIRCAPRCA